MFRVLLMYSPRKKRWNAKCVLGPFSCCKVVLVWGCSRIQHYIYLLVHSCSIIGNFMWPLDQDFMHFMYVFFSLLGFTFRSIYDLHIYLYHWSSNISILFIHVTYFPLILVYTFYRPSLIFLVVLYLPFWPFIAYLNKALPLISIISLVGIVFFWMGKGALFCRVFFFSIVWC